MLEKELISIVVDILSDEILHESYGIEVCNKIIEEQKLVDAITYRESICSDCTYDAVALSIFANKYCKSQSCVTKILK